MSSSPIDGAPISSMLAQATVTAQLLESVLSIEYPLHLLFMPLSTTSTFEDSYDWASGRERPGSHDTEGPAPTKPFVL